VNHPTPHIFEQTPDSLREWCLARKWQKFKADQILEWVYQKGIIDPARMSTLSKFEREDLARDMTFLSGDVVRHVTATDGTQKLLVEWTDGERHQAPGTGHQPEQEEKTSLPIADAKASHSDRQTECVMIPTEDRRTACISSQVGCPVGCKFCASGLGGLDGNLSTGRIVEQVWRLGQLPGVERISNVVFMGMGEPLANFNSVTSAIRIIASLWALGIGARKITISTVGLPQAIERLADEFELPVTLALSLHAPNDTLRRTLIPWAEYTTIDALLRACDKWFQKTGREITLEYILLGGVNDQPVHAEELAKVSKRLRANINLIRYNEVAGLPFNRPSTDDVRKFQEILRMRGLNSHIRASRGRDIAAACGQLRHEAAKG